MTADQIYEGMRLRVREWDDMANEFGFFIENDPCAINTTDYIFLDEMRYMCGKEFTVDSMPLDNVGRSYYTSVQDVELMLGSDTQRWYVSAAMLEPIDKTSTSIKIPKISQDDFLKLIK